VGVGTSGVPSSDSPLTTYYSSVTTKLAMADPLSIEETSDTPWERQQGESGLWFDRFCLYLSLGPARTRLAAVHAEDRRQNRPLTRWTPGSWRDAFKKFHWEQRAQAYDEHRRKQLFSQGYALDLKRIEKLDKLAERLEEKVDAMLAALKPSRGGFNDLMIGRYLETMDALAKETGGRVQRREVAGPGGGPLEVLLFLPEQERKEEDDSLLRGRTYIQGGINAGEPDDPLDGGYDDEDE
jgi:hypothetical protein